MPLVSSEEQVHARHTYHEPGPIDRTDALVDITLARPAPKGGDILVEVQAVSVNPVDAKVRTAAPPFDGRGERVLGWEPMLARAAGLSLLFRRLRA